MVTVLFTDGREKQYDADSAGPVGPLFVLRKYDRKRRKSDVCQTFGVEGVVWAKFENSIVLGNGQLKKKPDPRN